MLVLPNQTLLSINMITLLLWKATLLHLQILPKITKGRKQWMRILLIFHVRVCNALYMSIKLIMLTLEELFQSTLPMKMHQ